MEKNHSKNITTYNQTINNNPDVQYISKAIKETYEHCGCTKTSYYEIINEWIPTFDKSLTGKQIGILVVYQCNVTKFNPSTKETLRKQELTGEIEWEDTSPANYFIITGIVQENGELNQKKTQIKTQATVNMRSYIKQ